MNEYSTSGNINSSMFNFLYKSIMFNAVENMGHVENLNDY